jgi:putative transposase
MNQDYPIQFLCQQLGVSRSGYYKWLNRVDKLNRHEQNRNDLMNLIKTIHSEHPSYGYRDLTAVILTRTGWKLSALTVHKACKGMGIRSRAKHYHWKKSGDEHLIYKNIIQGGWNAQAPLEIVVTDMTVLRHRGRNYEWTYILDTFSNSIIASSISAQRGDARPYYTCLNQLFDLIKKEEYKDPIIFHSDQGTVYSSIGFQEAHKNYNIIRSMSRSGTPTDNPIIESLNGWIKAEIACDYQLSDWETLDSFMIDYIPYFNTERPAYKHNYKTPAQFLIEQGFHVF